MDKSEDSPGHLGKDDTPLPTVPMAKNVAMKLPAFWPDTSEVWLTQANEQFAIKAVTVSKTKFYYAVAVLPQKVAAEILNLIQAPPASAPYEVLKDKLITLYSLNDYLRFYSPRIVPVLSSYRIRFSSSTREDLRPLSFGFEGR